MKRQLMAEQWSAFAEKVLSPDTHPQVQRQEMRRAFYAGAQAILFRVIAEFAPESEPTDDDIKMLEGVKQELLDFAKLVAQGRA